MENLAYIHLVESYQDSEALELLAQERPKAFDRLNWPNFDRRTWIRLLALAVASAALLGVAPQAQARLSLGNRGSEVKNLQQQLRQLGYFKRNPTGSFGPLTKAAVIRFQTDAGLRPNGIVDERTEAALERRINSDEETVATRPSSRRPTLRRGVRSSEVRSLQELLTDAGFYNGSINGIYNSETQASVRQFQRDRRLAADGIVGSRTWAALNNDGGGVSTGNDPFNNSPFTNDLTLRPGDRGPTIEALQERLIALGYYNGRPNGNFDAQTRDAVVRFQQDSGLRADGLVDSTTSEAIGSPASIRKFSVSELQKRLKAKGFYRGRVDGVFGRQTRTAVKAAQDAYGVSENDILNEAF